MTAARYPRPMDPVVNELATRAEALAPTLRAQTRAIEAGRRLTPAAVGALRELGVFRLLAPRDAGGLEASPRTFVDVVEALARADSATAWCAMVAASTSLVGGWLAPDVARTIFAEGTACGVFAPAGRGVREGDGYRVEGRWPFASGCEHAEYRLGGFVVVEDGRPRMRQAFFRAADTAIVDTWDTSGLRGTGSHDLTVAGALVPDGWTVALTEAPPRAEGALYRYPIFGVLALGVSAVSLGLARAAIDALVELAREKRPAGGKRTLAERELVQADVARAEACLRAARALVHTTLEAIDAEVAAGAPMSAPSRASLRLAATHATAEATRALDLVHGAAGGTAVYEAGPFARLHRDAHVATQHAMVGASVYALAGRVLLGLPTDEATL